MNRRNFIQTTALVTSGTIAGMAFTAPSCGGKSVSGTVTLITGAISELKLLFLGNKTLLDKIIKLATDFNTDWVAGKFDSARTFFENLDTTVQQVITDLGVNATPRAKLLLASVGIAVRVIASLISEQNLSLPSAVSTQAQVRAGKTADRVRQLSNAADADWILKATQK